MNNTTVPIQLLVVDDDIQIRSGLEHLISNHFTEKEVTVFSCENGFIASQLLAQEPVDILITDIKMPLCSGIELLKIVNEKQYHCQSIVLSGYDDFNLVKDAMRLGASDYLLKPVDEGLLIHSIREMRKSITRSSVPATEATSPSSVLQMQRLLESFMGTAALPAPGLQHFTSANKICAQTPCLMCYIDIKRALYSNHLAMFQFLADRANTYLRTYTAANHPVHGVYGGIGSFWILLIFSSANHLSPEEVLDPFFKLLEQDHFKYSYTTSWYTRETIPLADIACKKGFEKYYFDLPYTFCEQENPEQKLSDYLEQAVSAAASYDYGKTIEYLEHCFAITNFLRPSIADLKKEMNHFVYAILSHNTAFIPVISASKFTDYDILEQIENAESLSVLQKGLYSSINHLIGELIHSMTNKDDYVIQKAKLYIQNNYQDDLTLNDVAAHVFLNSNYFSTLFKQKTGITFRNYLKNYRIEKAKELLLSTNLRIYEIALQVGYNEHSHFVRAFKSVTDQSPGEYREEQR